MTTTPQLYPDSSSLMGIDPLQRVFGSVSAGLVDAGFDEARTAAGIEGERRVAEILNGLTHDPDLDAAYVFHSLRLPGQIADMDHAVLVGNILILIDAKLWRGADAYLQTSQPGDTNPQATKVYAVRNGITEEAHEVSMNYRVLQWREAFPGLTVFGAVAVANEVPVQRADAAGIYYTLMSASTLTRYVNNLASTRTAKTDISDRNQLLMMLINPEYRGEMQLAAPAWPAPQQPYTNQWALPPVPIRQPYAYGWIVLMAIGIPATVFALMPFLGLAATVPPLVVSIVRLRRTRRAGLRGATMYVLPLVGFALITAINLLLAVLVITTGFQTEGTSTSA